MNITPNKTLNQFLTYLRLKNYHFIDDFDVDQTDPDDIKLIITPLGLGNNSIIPQDLKFKAYTLTLSEIQAYINTYDYDLEVALREIITHEVRKVEVILLTLWYQFLHISPSLDLTTPMFKVDIDQATKDKIEEILDSTIPLFSSN